MHSSHPSSCVHAVFPLLKGLKSPKPNLVDLIHISYVALCLFLTTFAYSFFLTHLTYIHVTLLVPRISVLRGVFPNLDDFALSGFPWNSLISSLFKSSFCSHFRLCILLPCGTSFYFKIYTPLALERLYSHSQGYIKHSKTTYTRKK